MGETINPELKAQGMYFLDRLVAWSAELASLSAHSGKGGSWTSGIVTLDKEQAERALQAFDRVGTHWDWFKGLRAEYEKRLNTCIRQGQHSLNRKAEEKAKREAAEKAQKVETLNERMVRLEQEMLTLREEIACAGGVA